MFWIIRLSQLSVHPLPTNTLDNGQHAVALCVLEDIESYYRNKMTENRTDKPREILSDFRRNVVVVGLSSSQDRTLRGCYIAPPSVWMNEQNALTYLSNCAT